VFHRGIDQRLKLRLVGNIAGHDDRLAARLFDLGCHLFAGLGLAAADHDFRAMLRHAERNGAADAPAGPGDDRDLAGKIEQIG
jgi:hypothetical protein